MAETPPEKPKLFCTSQVLKILTLPLPPGRTVKECLSGDVFWEERNGAAKNPWDPIQRDELVSRLTATGDIKRLAIVCAGGYGKTTNLTWLSAMLAWARQVPFLFPLDDPDLPASSVDFWEENIYDAFRAASGVIERKQKDRLFGTLRRAREMGRVSILLDSIDQALPKTGLKLLRSLVKDLPPNCPLVVTARPHAVFEQWDELIGEKANKWHFVRIEPLAEPQRHLLLGGNFRTPDGKSVLEPRRRDGVALYERLPAGGRELMANPRHIEYVHICEQRKGGMRPDDSDYEPDRLEEYAVEDLKSASHLFAGAVDHAVRRGMKAEGAKKIGRLRNHETAPDEADFALDLLAALAYAMYARLDEKTPSGDRVTPNVAVVEKKQMGALRVAVVKLLKAAKLVKKGYDENELKDHDLPALDAMNTFIKFDLVDKGLRRQEDFRWHDRTLQEFLAARWLARYATETDADRLRSWKFDNRTEKSPHRPLWEFLVEMPKAVRTDKWFTSVGVLFDPIRAGKVVRSCEMIYRAWPMLEKSERGKALIAEWQQEFQLLCKKWWTKAGRVAKALRDDGFVLLASPGSKLPGDTGGFWMGSHEDEAERDSDEFQHWVELSPFRIGRTPVTNEQYELFDPGHEGERKWKWEKDVACHPVVRVDWWEGWCFAEWCGCALPSEAQWEYACRGGRASGRAHPEESLEYPFYWGRELNGTQANCYGNYPYGTEQKGPELGRTSAVGEYAGKAPKSHPWGLEDVHGNVWEWCSDWYDGEYYAKSPKEDPTGPESGSDRVFRGGSWDSSARGCRAASRSRISPVIRDLSLGFRLAAGPSGQSG